jgi:hypothetical protein
MDWLHLGLNLRPWCLLKKHLQDMMAVLDEIISSVDLLTIAKKISKKFLMLRYCKVKVTQEVCFQHPLSLFTSTLCQV